MQPEDETIHGDSMDSVLLTLHKTNQSLQEENCLLRNEVNTAEDKVQQLSHELSQKQMLMTLYHNEIESLERAATVNQDSQQRTTLATLEARAHQLEHEKWELTLELESRKADLEERGAKLDALKLSYLKQIENLRTKASKHEEAVRAQEEKNAALQLEKDLLVEKLKTWHHVVDQVKTDLEMKDRQIEDFVMRQHNFLDEAKAKQEEIDNLQKLYEARRDEARSLRMSAPRLYGRPRSYSAEECYDHHRSIRDELEDSLRRENQPPSPEYSPLSSPISKVFRTVRSANLLLDELENGHQLPVSDPTTQMDRSSTYSIGGDSGCGDLGSDDENSFGHPGIRSPEIKRRRRPMFPKKLQIIKPLEGSETLGHWQRLATPSLTKLLEVRDGVFSRDELESERGSRDWTDQGLGLAEPEEDDDPEVSRTCDREMADIREFRQPLTDGFIQGISCYGVKQHHRQSSVNTLETEEPRERSNSLVEKVRRSGLRASSLPVNSHVPVSQKSLQDHVVSGVASAFTNCPNSPVRRKSVPAQMGLNVCSHNRFGRPTSPTPSGLQLSPGGFGVADMMTRQILHFIRRMSYGDAPTEDNPTVKVKSSSQETTQASYYTGPKLRLRQGAPSSSRRRTSRLKIKIVKNKKPPTYSPLENKTDQGVSVLHTITSLRRNNLLIGGMPEVHTSSTSDATSFLDDITVGTIFSY